MTGWYKSRKRNIMNLPTISSYGDYSSSNYGVNSLVVSFPKLDLYYSYKTIVAYRFKGDKVVRQNDWAQTTGKHLNWIDRGDKKSRISGEEFEAKLGKILTELNLA